MGFVAINKSKERVEAYQKVNGVSVFTDDIEMDGMLYAYGLTPRYPFAYIKKIDTAQAEKAPGVSCVLTHKDLPGDPLMGVEIKDQFIFAVDRVITIGDVLALVVADTREHAKDAAALINVEYEKLPTITGFENAMASDLIVNPIKKDDNLCSSCFIHKGNPEGDRPADEISVETSYSCSWQEHAYLETESVIGIPGRRDREVTVLGSLQTLYDPVIDINRSLDVPMKDITTIAPAIGGSFGGKLESPEVMAVRVALAALKTGKPVKYTLTREESMQQSHKRHPFDFSVEMSCDKEGKFTCMREKATVDAGPYANMTPGVIFKAISLGAGPYVVPNVDLSAKAAYTNSINGGSMRGFGNPQGTYARECTIDELAEQVGISPLELRLRNVMHRGDASGSNQIIDFEDIGAEEALRKTAEKLDYENKYWKYREENPGKTIRRGVGLSLCYRGNSYGTGVPDTGRCFLEVKQDGTALLAIGMTEIGQGLHTAMIQMAAEALGISDTEVSICESNSRIAPNTGICNASRGTFVGGRAIIDAGKRIHDVIREAIVEEYGCEAADISFADNRVSFGDQTISFKEATAITYGSGRTPAALGSYKVPDPKFNAETGEGDTFYEYTYSCIGTEVEVDICTGQIKVLQTVSAHDIGRVINPKLAEGQILGGAVMAQGYALMEDVKCEGGICKHQNLDEYMIPNIMDVPDSITPILIENPNDRGPWGARSLGEPTLDPGLGAYMNAVNCALGELGKVRKSPVDLKSIIFNSRV